MTPRYFRLRIRFLRHRRREVFLAVASFVFIGIGFASLWAASLRLPDLKAFDERRIEQSTKIYDRTGEVLLFDLYGNAQRTVLPIAELSRDIKNATVAIEDAEFYQHRGIKITSIIRAVIANLTSFGFSQGGSTITQQVVKNSLLTNEKTITRKFKEWVLALKLERVLSKEEILAMYLNESPYGGNVYGIEEAGERYFAKHAADLSLAESAYLAALPQAPTYYSPYGNHKDALEERKNLVLQKMLEYEFISQNQF